MAEQNISTETIKNAWRKTGYSYFDVPPPNLIEALQHDEAMRAKEYEDENYGNVFVDETIYDGHDVVGEAVDGEDGGIWGGGIALCW